MSLKFALPLALAACLPGIGVVHATTYAETTDAGDLPASAQIVTVPIGYSTTSALFTTNITGTLALTNAISESDMFQITIAYPSTFTASTNFFSAGSNNFDTQLALFTSAGVGIAANDDAASGGSQSTLTVTITTPGTYDLLISGSGRYAASGGGLIFPNFTDGTTDPSGTYGPTGAGGGSAISGYTGSSNEGGAYNVSVSAVPAVVPEPSSLMAALAGGFGGLALVFRRRTAK